MSIEAARDSLGLLYGYAANAASGWLARQAGKAVGEYGSNLISSNSSSSNSVSIFYPGDKNNGGNAGYGRYAVNLKEPYFTFKLETPSGNNIWDNSIRDSSAVTGIITGLTIGKAEVVSVTPTVGKDIYLYVGGESAWEIYMEGVALQTCNSEENGFKKVLEFYTKENVAKTGKSCKLTLCTNKDGCTFRVYLQSFSIRSIRDINAFQFNFKFYGIKIA